MAVACGGASDGEAAPSEPAAAEPGSSRPGAGSEGGASAGSAGSEGTTRAPGPEPVESGAPDCADAPRAVRAVATVLEHARGVAGISTTALSGCAFESARCGPVSLGADPSRCVVDVQAQDAFWHVRVTPAPLPSAPRWFEANLEPTALPPPLRFWVSASTWARIGSSMTIGGVDESITHGHGGDGAEIDRARFLVQNGASGPITLRVREVAWLTSYGCEVPAAVTATPAMLDLRVGDVVSTTQEITIPPGESTLVVRFAPQSAYYSYCQRFAARVTLSLGHDTMSATAEWLVGSRLPR